MADGVEDPETRRKILHESWSILHRDTVECLLCYSFYVIKYNYIWTPYLIQKKKIAQAKIKCVLAKQSTIPGEFFAVSQSFRRRPAF